MRAIRPSPKVDFGKNIALSLFSFHVNHITSLPQLVCKPGIGSAGMTSL
jgi:hypothetical protein